MQIKLLHDLVEEMAGEGTGRIVEILFGKKDVNEFVIAKKMELTINQVRNILYKLSAEDLVSFIRKKDKRKGWYIYYWTLKTEKCMVNLEKSLLFKISELKNALNNRETKRYYICELCDIEVTEEKALENGFTCEECAEVYTLANNSGVIRDIKSKITRTEKDLGLIKDELEKIREKERKRVKRTEKREGKIAKAKRVAKKKVKKEKKKSGKKVKVKGGKKKVGSKNIKKKILGKGKKKTSVKKVKKKRR